MIERVYPGVFVVEVAFVAKTIEGVPTSGSSFVGPGRAPGWTDRNPHDPGATLLQLFSWTAEPLLYRSGPIGDAIRRAHAHWNGQACAKIP